ncbi:2OG-Fe(II) oxygenase family protein [Scytonema sp. NUACC26]|uniref:2OG-Fe(II) oxygenase family protein n=1 Tax=Scytonema sp. NUACC26 TaxID=3140176 RepID=UPI0034DC53F2
MVLNWNALQTAVVYDNPYRWILCKNLIAQEVQLELIKSYPSPTLSAELSQENVSLWTPIIATEEAITQLQKIHDMWRDRFEKGQLTSSVQNLGEVWQKLIKDLWTPTYREIMEELSGLRLNNHAMTIQFRRNCHTRYPYSDQTKAVYTPHLDGSPKNLTHLFFFHQEWSLDWGGYFRVLNDNQPESIFYEVPPLINYSLALVRSERSWHMVTPVSQNAPQLRLSLQIAFWNLKS